VDWHSFYSEDEVIDRYNIVSKEDLKEAARKRQAFNEKLMPGAGIEPAWCKTPRDFKSLASTNSATRAVPTAS
jgi:hypothetical protein